MKLTSALFRQGQRGEYRLPHTLTQGDKLILLITYPAEESLSGTAQRFVIPVSQTIYEEKLQHCNLELIEEKRP
ncbi:hypothetical protein CVS42_08265 [Aeromonas veronii]|uniref:hypothetical protein n=1 Tax=Aeromonas veronii TaxID=654 RepID=UPI000C287042|nr:hypothetical protein [Aeromonas veronii]ATY80819.1 hypothetical protein CVS42_08265 [Aeromonas veronii]